MQLLGNRSLALGLRWVTDAAIVGLVALLVWVLVIMAGQSSPGGSHEQQATIYVDLELPTELTEPASADVDPHNFESNRSQIHFRTERLDLRATVLRFLTAIVGFGVLIWILWHVRQVLASLVARKPLTLVNARRFRSVGLLILFVALLSPLERALGYIQAQQLFLLLPPRGFFAAYVDHIEVTRLFQGLFVILMAEVMRLGAEYRADSEEMI